MELQNCSGVLEVICRFLGHINRVARCDVAHSIMQKTGDNESAPTVLSVSVKPVVLVEVYVVSGLQNASVLGVCETGLYLGSV